MASREILEIIKKYIKILKDNNIYIEKIILFGSYAYGNPKEYSDIDLAIISKNFGKDRFIERSQLTKFAYKIDSRIEPFPINTNEFYNESWKTLIHEIKTKGIEIL